jgi:hypothetical protein
MISHFELAHASSRHTIAISRLESHSHWVGSEAAIVRVTIDLSIVAVSSDSRIFPRWKSMERIVHRRGSGILEAGSGVAEALVAICSVGTSSLNVTRRCSCPSTQKERASENIERCCREWRKKVHRTVQQSCTVEPWYYSSPELFILPFIFYISFFVCAPSR